MVGHGPDYRAKKVLSPKVGEKRAERRSESVVTFQIDSGTMTNTIGCGSGCAFLWMNRFVPYPTFYPFALTQVGVIWPSSVTDLTQDIELVILEDTDGDDDPADATIKYTEFIHPKNADGVTWSTYDLASVQLLSGPGDFYIGFINVEGLADYPAALDETVVTGTESFLAQWGGGEGGSVPWPLTWPPDYLGTIDSTCCPGTWNIRAVGISPPPPVLQLFGTSFGDSCPSGGGDGDGIPDPGETITYAAVIKNAGFATATGALATLTSPYPITITSGTASLGSISAGLTKTATFAFGIPVEATCGTLIPITITVDIAQEPYTWTFPTALRVGDYTQGATVGILTQDFETWPLTGWTVTYSGGEWIQGSSGCFNNYTGGTGEWATADAYCIGGGFTSAMESPSFNLTSPFGDLDSANLQYKTMFYDYYGATTGDVDITTDGAATWINLEHIALINDYFLSEVHDLNLTPFVGTSGLQVRFLFDSADPYFVWQVDDVWISGKFADVCNQTPCLGASADLAVTKSGPATAVAGTDLTYALNVTNGGPSDAQGVSLSDLLPAGLAFISQAQTAGPAFTLGTAGNQITDTIATLPAGASASFTVTAHVNASVSDGTILSNAASITAATGDTVPANNNSTTSTNVSAQADLSVIKTGTATVEPGGGIAYSVTVTNHGPSDAKAVALSDIVPAAAIFLSQSQTSGPAFTLGSAGNQITDTLASLSAGSSANFSILAEATATAPGGLAISNTAIVTASTTDLVPANNASTADTTVICPTVTISPASLPGGMVNVVYNQILTAGPAGAIYTFAVSAGALPPGLTLSPSAGLLNGIPTAAGTFTFTVTATAASGCTGSATYILAITTFDLTLVDDLGRSALCVNSTTGSFAYTVLRGMGVGTYTGTGVITRYNGQMLLKTPAGLPYSLSLQYLERYHKATASYTNRPARILSSLMDNNTLNNPDVCSIAK